MIVARLQQSLQEDPSCSPKFKSECSKLLGQLTGLMYVEMGRPKSKNTLNITHMRDVASVGRSESSQGSVSQLVSDIFSISGRSDSATGSSMSSTSHSQHSQRHVETTTPAPSQAQGQASRLYQCTYPTCKSSFATKTDWKRHEETVHWLQQKYMCLECDTSAIDSSGMIECLYCSGSAEDLGDIQTHNLECDPARKLGRTFTRKDKFRDHLRLDHGISLDSTTSTWVFDIESQWPRQCGFCGYIVDIWAQRANHIEDHFKKGYRISSWKLPFPRQPDPKGKGPRIDSNDGSSTSSSSNNSVFSAVGRCTVRGIVSCGTATKDAPENQSSFGNQGELRNTQKILVHRRASTVISRSSQTSFSISSYRQQSEDRKIRNRDVVKFLHRVPDDGMYSFRLHCHYFMKLTAL
jgi:hypothetical protein